MIKIALPVEFNDGKQLHDATLKLISMVSPAIAKIIHSDHNYKPFSVQLPNIVNILDPALESVANSFTNVKILKQLSFAECFGGEPDKFLNLIFSRTLFRHPGASYPLPDPWNVITSWKNRWNSISPIKVTISLPIAQDRKSARVEIQYMKIDTAKIQIADYRPVITFSGPVKIKWLGDEKELRELCALAKFAEFAGTGSKTTMGCGVTSIAGLAGTI